MIDFITVDVWGSDVLFIVDPTMQEIKEFFKRPKNKLPQKQLNNIIKDIKNVKGCGGFTTDSDKGFIVFIRDPFKFFYSSHEIFHAVHKILWQRGVYLDETAEPWAYTIGYITEWYIKWLCREKKLLPFVPEKYVSKEYLNKLEKTKQK